MKTINILFLTIFLFCFTGCEDKKSTADTRHEKNITKEMVSEENSTELSAEELELRKKYTFQLSDMNDTNHSITLDYKHIDISDVSEKIILLNFFATWCPPCKGEMPYLADLKKKYEGKLFIAGILVNDTPDKEHLQTFLKESEVNYFISNSSQNDALADLAAKRLKLGENFPIPLTILFKNGHYYSHYEGAVPVEMLEHDIKNAMSKE